MRVARSCFPTWQRRAAFGMGDGVIDQARRRVLQVPNAEEIYSIFGHRVSGRSPSCGPTERGVRLYRTTLFGG
jgi:hypothetical protein